MKFYTHKLLSLALLSTIVIGFQINCMDKTKYGAPIGSHENKHLSENFNESPCLWASPKGKVVTTVLKELSIISATFNRTGKLLLIGSTDKKIRVWDVKAKKELSVVNYKGRILSATFSHDDTMILTGSDDYTAQLWDSTDVKHLKLIKTIGQDEEKHTDWVYRVAFSPDDSILLTGACACDDGAVRLWDVKTGKLLLVIKEEQKNSDIYDFIKSAVFGPDGTTILTKLANGIVKLRDASTGNELKSVEGNESDNNCVVLNNDSTLIFSSFGGNKIGRVLNFTTDEQLGVEISLTNMSSICSIALSTDGKSVLIVSREGKAHLLETASGEQLMEFHVHSDDVTFAAFSSNNRTVLIGSKNSLYIYTLSL
ncbi:hypothetical protein H0X06_06295 [Candidatus Dependentiae bacterium]|nr:hypothetical protein [Candidatus Dependentiae bacterium]